MLYAQSRGACWDNACSETLFGSLQLQVERLHGELLDSIRQAKDEVLAWLPRYNQSRMHSTLNSSSPAEFEQAWRATMDKIAASKPAASRSRRWK
jgi:transposase InsO family protein